MFYFYDTLIIDGNSEMPVPRFEITNDIQVGITGDGYIRIMLLSIDLVNGFSCKYILHNYKISLLTLLMK